MLCIECEFDRHTEYVGEISTFWFTIWRVEHLQAWKLRLKYPSLKYRHSASRENLRFNNVEVIELLVPQNTWTLFALASPECLS